MKKQLFTLLLCLLPFFASAYDFCVDGIYYNKLSDTECEVTYDKPFETDYSGSLTIPSSVSVADCLYSVTTIGKAAFCECDKLTAVTLSNSVTTIAVEAFSDCTSLTSITIPNSVTTIAESAFWGCSSLTTITIPNSVTSIGDGAFAYCRSATSIIVDSDNPNYDSRDNCNAIIETSTNALIAGCVNTIIPNSVAEIRRYAFYGSESLTTITIPESVTSIGWGAFYDCFALSTVTCNSATPPSLGEKVFECTPQETLMVPQGSLAAYQEAAGWNEFKNIVEFGSPISISAITNNAAETQIYNLDGTGADKLRQGINLIRKADGSVDKVFFK